MNDKKIVRIVSNVFQALLYIGFVIYIPFTLLFIVGDFNIEVLKEIRNWLINTHAQTSLKLFSIATLCVFIPSILLISFRIKEKIQLLMTVENKIDNVEKKNINAVEQMEEYTKRLNTIDASFETQKENYNRVKNSAINLKITAEYNLSDSLKLNKKLNKIASANKHLKASDGFKKTWKNYKDSYMKLFKEQMTF